MSFLMLTLCITILLTVLWNISTIARYYLKFLTFAVLSLIFATAPIPIMLFRPRNSKNALIPAYGLRKMSWLLGINYTVEGKENIVKNNGCVVLINHQSALDLIVLAELWPVMDNCAVISKKEVFYLWPFGLASWLWGTIFIDRVNAGQAKNILNQTGKAIKNRGARILMFPEGTRSMKKTLLPFKKGAFHVALSSQCPIQPVVVDRYSFLNNYKFGEANITITILPPIETKDKSIEDLSQLMENTYNTMSNCFLEKCPAQNKK